MKSHRGWLLATAPLTTIAALAAAPYIPISDASAAALAFGLAALLSVTALALSAPAKPTLRGASALALASVAALVATALLRPPPRTALVIVNTALLALAHTIGGAIGHKVQHPGHLLPACAVAAAADVASLLHPSGPTRAIASSERALSLLTVGAPLVGTRDVAPAVGFGDVVFLALVYGVATAHRASMIRATLAGAFGLVAAGALAASLKRPFPALVSIAAFVVLMIPEARAIRPEDKKTTRYAITVAAAVALGSLLRYGISR